MVDKGSYLEFTLPGQQQQELAGAEATDRPLVGVRQRLRRFLCRFLVPGMCVNSTMFFVFLTDMVPPHVLPILDEDTVCGRVSQILRPLLASSPACPIYSEPFVFVCVRGT